MLLLGIDTATDLCSVALFDGEMVLGEISIQEPRSHASRLVPLIQRVLEEARRKPMELDVIAVSAGPGSYTGLRIGASTAKGLAYALDAELVAVPSLEALASSVPAGSELPILAVLPSRRDEVYAAVYRITPDGMLCLLEPVAIGLTSIDAWLPDGRIMVVGPAAGSVVDAVGDADRLQGLATRSSAAHIARLGFHRYESAETENVAAWEPYYLKSFVAKPPRPIFP